jgi:UDPglucose 6-dehydrogenase
MREASSVVLLRQAWAAGASIRAYDPKATDEARRIFGERRDLTYCAGAYEALDGADVLAVVTEWQEFRSPDFDLMREKLSRRAVFDGRNIYDPATVARAGLQYFGIGRSMPAADAPA